MALYQGMTLVVPHESKKRSPASAAAEQETAGAKARFLFAASAARLKPCPDTKRRVEVHRFTHLKFEMWATQPGFVTRGNLDTHHRYFRN